MGNAFSAADTSIKSYLRRWPLQTITLKTSAFDSHSKVTKNRIILIVALSLTIKRVKTKCVISNLQNK